MTDLSQEQERTLDLLIQDTLPFILNRLDNVAVWVTEWMPPEDNEQHHNAVEHLLRIRQELKHVERFLVSLDPVLEAAMKQRGWSSPTRPKEE